MNLVDLFREFPDVPLNTLDLGVGRVDLFSSLLGRVLIRCVDLGQRQSCITYFGLEG